MSFCDNCLMVNKNMINKLGISNPSSNDTATCKLLFFSFERGRIAFLRPRSRAG